MTVDTTMMDLLAGIVTQQPTRVLDGLTVAEIHSRLASIRPPHDTVVCRPGDAPRVREVLVRHGLQDQYEVLESSLLPDGPSLITFSQAALGMGLQLHDNTG